MALSELPTASRLKFQTLTPENLFTGKHAGRDVSYMAEIWYQSKQKNDICWWRTSQFLANKSELESYFELLSQDDTLMRRETVSTSKLPG